VILLIGGRGQLGQAFQKALFEAGREFTLAPPLIPWPRTLLALAAYPEIETVINCAAYTDVRGAEDPENWKDAVFLNTTFPAELAQVCKAEGKRYVTFSTDYVFGNCNPPEIRWPWDRTSPLNTYGRTKRAGEILMQTTGALIVRTAGLFSPYGPNFVQTIFDRLRLDGHARVRNDLMTSVTNADNLARAVLRELAASPPVPLSGVHHYVDSEPVTWFDVAEEIERHTPGRGAAKRILSIEDIDDGVYRPNCSALAPTIQGPMNWRDEVARVVGIFKEKI